MAKRTVTTREYFDATRLTVKARENEVRGRTLIFASTLLSTIPAKKGYDLLRHESDFFQTSLQAIHIADKAERMEEVDDDLLTWACNYYNVQITIKGLPRKEKSSYGSGDLKIEVIASGKLKNADPAGYLVVTDLLIKDNSKYLIKVIMTNIDESLRGIDLNNEEDTMVESENEGLNEIDVVALAKQINSHKKDKAKTRSPADLEVEVARLKKLLSNSCSPVISKMVSKVEPTWKASGLENFKAFQIQVEEFGLAVDGSLAIWIKPTVQKALMQSWKIPSTTPGLSALQCVSKVLEGPVTKGMHEIESQLLKLYKTGSLSQLRTPIKMIGGTQMPDVDSWQDSVNQARRTLTNRSTKEINRAIVAGIKDSYDNVINSLEDSNDGSFYDLDTDELIRQVSTELRSIATFQKALKDKGFRWLRVQIILILRILLGRTKLMLRVSIQK